MSRTTKRRLGFGILGTCVLLFIGVIVWHNLGGHEGAVVEAAGPTTAPVAVQAGETPADKLAALQDRFGAAAKEKDAAQRQTLLEGVRDDIGDELTAGTFSDGLLLSARQLLVGVLGASGDQAGTLEEVDNYLDELVTQKGAQVARTALRRFADDAFAHRKFAEAGDFYSELQQRWPEDPEANYGAYKLAECMERQGGYADAITAYQGCIQSFPSGIWTGEAYLRAAWCCRQTGDFTTAQTLYESLQKARPGTRYPVTAQWRLAEMLKIKGDFEDSIAAYQSLKTMLEPSWEARIDAIISELSEQLL